MINRLYLSLLPLILGLLTAVGPTAADIKLKQLMLDNGVKLEYRVTGPKDAPVVLMIHGVTDSGHSWTSIMPYLETSYRVYAPTLRGHGDSEKPAGGYRIAVFAEDMVAFMDKLGIDHASVVGHSLGSLVAHQLASVYPQRVDALALIGSAPTLVNNPVVTYLWDEVIGLEEFQDPIDPEFILEWQTGPNPVDPEFFETVLSETAKVPARVWKAAFRGLLTDDHRAFLDDVDSPTLIIWGDADLLIAYDEQMALLHAISGATLLVYPGTGHNTHWEQPAQVAADLLTFLQGRNALRLLPYAG
jgi:pimeloyl-ACP methyl ester carboxylesterase